MVKSDKGHKVLSDRKITAHRCGSCKSAWNFIEYTTGTKKGKKEWKKVS
jgi:hypothetical protein